MRTLPFLRPFSAVLLTAQLVANAQFVAYNDHAPSGLTHQNATTWDAFDSAPGASGPLKNILTGAELPVILTITREGSVGGAGGQGVPAPGTPLYETFNGFVDFQGAPNASIELATGGILTYTFTGLNPNKRYTFKGSSVRGNAAYTDRWTLFEIAGAISFTRAHTKNVLTNELVQLISTSQAAINTGVNNTEDTGDMVVWTDIVPAPDGSFEVTSQQYTGPVPNGGSSGGSKGYGLTGFRLEEFDNVKLPVAITIHPQPQTVGESSTVTFTALAIGNPPPTYQWYKGATPIPNATNSTFSYLAPLSDNGALFKVIAANVVSNVTYTAESSTALLQVNADTTAPTLLDAQPLGLGQVRIIFSEPLLASAATNTVNYTITSASGSPDIVSGSLDASQTIVTLDVDSLIENVVYTVAVSGIKDLSATGNVIAQGAQKTFAAVTYAPIDIGNPPVAGGITAVSGGYNIRGGGFDIRGTRDQFHFGYLQKDGDFDLKVRVADLTVTDAYVKAGLMARENLGATSRFAAVFASSAQLGSFFEYRTAANANAVLTGPTLKFPSNYPWAWLRLRREGNALTGHGSFDGNNWQLLGSNNVAFPSQIYVGMAVTAGASNAVALAKFRDLGPVENPTNFVYTPTRENLAPSNRRTGLAISEIMYHAKPRSDAKNLDFIEIYNGEPIFADLTGWKITGGVDFTFPSGFTLEAGQFVVIAADPSAFQSVYGITNVLGPYASALDNNSDTIILRNAAGAVRCEVTYSSKNAWPASTDGAGHSLVLLRPSYGENDARAWGQSQLIGGSPGYDDPIVPHPSTGVVINEILSVTDNQSPFVELYNASTNIIDLAGCFITDSITTNKFRIPNGTLLASRNWISFPADQLGFTNSSAGGTIYLIAADQSRVLDSIRFTGQERNVSIGRAPDGSALIRRLAGSTPGQPNAARKQDPIVINELMYKSVTNVEDDQFVELYNQTSGAIDIGGWRFTDGIDFTFAPGTSIPGNSYLVVARNLQRLLTNYTQLNTNNTVGDFDGQLQGGGERIALSKPGLAAGEYITVAEVTYMTGGRWPELADGMGSSLELTDPHSDPAFPSNWGASDETRKSSWATYEATDTLTLANQNYAANRIYVMGHETGEYLLDDFEVIRGGTNMVTNPGFETGLTGWSYYGTHRNSGLRSGDAATGNNSLYVRSSEVGDEGPNSVRGNLSATISASQTVTIRVKARWLSGWPEVLLRIRGNGAELPLKLKIPSNLGTPGQANSRRVNNAGPAITEVTHYPPVPAANQAVLVTARVSDPDGLGPVNMIFRVDPSGSPSAITMRDDGTTGDRLAGDGIYSAIIPARSSGLVAYRVQAQDLAAPSAVKNFPSDDITREALVRWGDPVPFGSLAHYHLWATSASENDVLGGRGQDRTYRDCTVVSDLRVIYNAGWRNKGSPFHSGVGSYSTMYPDDDLFMGADKHVLRSTGNGESESTDMAGDVSYWIAEKMGLPFNHARYVRVYRNGGLHYRLDYDLEVPDRSIAKDWYGGGGVADTLYKIAGWFEYDDGPSGGTGSVQWANLGKKPGNAPPFKTAAYRFNFQAHPGSKSANDYSLLFNIVAAANGANNTNRINQLMNIVDMEQWMRTFAHRRLVGDWDAFGIGNGQNMYMYAPLGERAKLLPWDTDFVLGLGNGPGGGFYSGSDPTINNLFNIPVYNRMLSRAYLDAANGPLVKATSDAQFDARRNMMTKNNVSASAPTGLKSYIASERASILSQINNNTAFNITTPNTTTANPTATLTGTAPVSVATIEVNGIPYPIDWVTTTTWSIRVPLGAANNVLQVVGKDLRGLAITNGARQVTFTYTGALPQAIDWVVINEIHYNAFVHDAEFIEILNTHPSFAFDLSGCKLKGADFTFPPGTLIQPNNFLVIAKDSAVFAQTYGINIPIVGEYAGSLQNPGETLSLVKPGATSASDVVINEVSYESIFPWPASANGFGPSLQLIDANQDTSRPGNWAVTAVNDPNQATPGRANITRATLDSFPAIWINEIVANNQTGATDNAGEHDPWIELYNAGTTQAELSLFYLTADPANAIQWQFPPGTTLNPGEFLVVWLDGQPEQTTPTEFHANFRLAAAPGLIALTRLQNANIGGVDYVYYPAANPDQSYGAIADGAPETRRNLFLPTLGAPNNPGNLLVPVSINEWMSSNTRIIADPADNDFDDWFELYNRGTNTVDLDGYFISDTTTNATKFRIPHGYTIPPGGFLLVWADEETGQNNTNRTDLHVNFKMSKDGDTIALFTPNAAMVDAVTFTAQNDNAAAGRYPDGGAIFALPTPTPRAPNTAPTGTRFTGYLFDGANLTLGWRTTAGRTYRLEYKSDLNSQTWTQFGNDLPAQGATLNIPVEFNLTTNRYFRVVQIN